MWRPYAQVSVTLGLITHIKHIFARLDTNNEGQLDGMALGNWITSKGIGVTWDSLQKMIELADTNNDGALNFWEFLGIQVYLSLRLQDQFELHEWLLFATQSAYADQTSAIEYYDPNEIRLPQLPSPPAAAASHGTAPRQFYPPFPYQSPPTYWQPKQQPFMPHPPMADAYPAAP
jgi:hypothetical protein